jgi:hypothetical protein
MGNGIDEDKGVMNYDPYASSMPSNIVSGHEDVINRSLPLSMSSNVIGRHEDAINRSIVYVQDFFYGAFLLLSRGVERIGVDGTYGDLLVAVKPCMLL